MGISAWPRSFERFFFIVEYFDFRNNPLLELGKTFYLPYRTKEEKLNTLLKSCITYIYYTYIHSAYIFTEVINFSQPKRKTHSLSFR